MSDRARITLALAGCWMFVLAVLAGTTFLVGADLANDERASIEPIVSEHMLAALIIATVLCAPGGLVVQALFKRHVVAARRLSEDARVMLKANPEHRAPLRGSAELARLARDLNDFATARAVLQHDVETRITESNARLEQERNRLAALMAELAQSVLVCNREGRILLYNTRAERMLRTAPGGAGGGGHALVGLGRSVYAIFERSVIDHAAEALRERMSADPTPVSAFVTTTPAGRLVRVQMALVRGGSSTDAHQVDALAGFVLLMDDITRRMETDQQRDVLLQTLTQGTRASLGSIRAAVETIASFPDMDDDARQRFIRVIGEESRELTSKLNEAASSFAGVLRHEWPLEPMRGADVIAAARRQIETRVGLPTKLQSIDESVWLRIDSYSLLQAITYLARRLRNEFGIREIRFNISRRAALAYLDLVWTGAPLGSETTMTWQTDSLDQGGESSTLSLRDLIERHNGEIWYEIDKASQWELFRLALPLAEPEHLADTASDASGSRPEFYDFDLFAQPGSTPELDAQPLATLQYTVFDSETTGLDPSGGDEIVAIAAVRIVNGRLLRYERFERLVNPHRRMSTEARAITGIDEATLADCPPIEHVLPAFHRFCTDTVLVAHNAAFDMRFLQLKEGATGVRFTQPVLDTLLLSAVLHPHLGENQLEAIAQRMGVAASGRHTALGDAVITAEIFLRMIPLLADRGIRTLGQARAAAQECYLARLAY